MKRRGALLALAALMILSSCSSDLKDEPAISASLPEEIISESETLPEPEPTEEVTEEVTSPPETEETTEEIPETTLPEVEGIELLTPKQLLDFVEMRAPNYYSFRRHTLTSVSIDVLGSETFTETDSYLSVKGNSAAFRRGGKDGFEDLYLVENELYTENELGKCRIGGYSREKFLSLVADMPISTSFVGGEMQKEGEDHILTFTELGDDGKDVIREMLGLPAEYSVSFGKTDLLMRVDSMANMLSSAVEIGLSVSMDGQVLMTVGIKTETTQTDIAKDIELTLPKAEDHVFFTDDEALAKYSSLICEIGDFSSSHEKFEYSVRDDMMISSGSIKLPLSSKTVYAYNSKIGASIDKSFDLGDGTGTHTTLTHFNKRRGFSQIDGGSIFVDTTVNANNLAFTLYYPFTTSFFAFEHCTGMDSARSDGVMLAFTLSDNAVNNIAGNLLLRAGVLSSSANLSEVTAYTYIKLGTDGKIASIGYEFEALADVNGKTYELERKVELKIISRNSANVKVIYIEVEDEE